MSKTLFTGSGVAIVTPFTKDGSVNIPKLNELIDFQIDNGTDAIIICGTTGESATLSDEEHIQAIRAAVAHTAGRIPVIAGTGSNDTNYCIHLSEEAQELGADGLLLVTPYYNKTTQAGLIRHFTSVADRVSIPIVLYNVPSRTGMNIAPETYLALETSQHRRGQGSLRRLFQDSANHASVRRRPGRIFRKRRSDPADSVPRRQGA